MVKKRKGAKVKFFFGKSIRVSNPTLLRKSKRRRKR